MPGIQWNTEEKAREWTFAKEKLMQHGRLLRDGSKLRRKDYPADLNHSFMVIDNRIIALSGKGIYLGEGLSARAKLAEDETGNLIALKIVTHERPGESDSVKESYIARDLGIAGQGIVRNSTSKRFPTKHYIDYQYLGTSLYDYIWHNPLSLDKCYDLCIQTSLAMHELHSGRKSKSRTAYRHNDVSLGNLVIDDQNNVHFIDFGRSDRAYGPANSDILRMLLLFFTPIAKRDSRRDHWIFGDWLGEYDVIFDKPDYSEEFQVYRAKRHYVYIYADIADKKENGSLPVVHYLVRDTAGVCQKGTVALEGLGLSCFPSIKEEQDEYSWHFGWGYHNKSLLESKVLEIACQNGHAINTTHRSDVLFDLLKDPFALFDKGTLPTAFEIAEILTLCRFNLESYLRSFTGHSLDERLEAVNLLNSLSMQLLALNEKLHRFSAQNNELDIVIKKHIVAHLFAGSITASDSSVDALNKQLESLPADDGCSIKQNLDNIVKLIEHEREAKGLGSLMPHPISPPSQSAISAPSCPVPTAVSVQDTQIGTPTSVVKIAAKEPVILDSQDEVSRTQIHQSNPEQNKTPEMSNVPSPVLVVKADTAIVPNEILLETIQLERSAKNTWTFDQAAHFLSSGSSKEEKLVATVCMRLADEIKRLAMITDSVLASEKLEIFTKYQSAVLNETVFPKSSNGNFSLILAKRMKNTWDTIEKNTLPILHRDRHSLGFIRLMGVVSGFILPLIAMLVGVCHSVETARRFGAVFTPRLFGSQTRSERTMTGAIDKIQKLVQDDDEAKIPSVSL